jgi:hypothetical protein
MSSTAVLDGFEPTARQLEVARACLDPSVRVVVLDGAIRSGKTQAAARILLEWAVEQPAAYLVARSTYRSLKDSTEILQPAARFTEPPSRRKALQRHLYRAFAVPVQPSQLDQTAQHPVGEAIRRRSEQASGYGPRLEERARAR